MSYIISIAVIVVIFIILFKVFRLVLRLLVLAVFLLLAYFTNPDYEQHKEAVIRKADKNNVVLGKQEIARNNFLVFSLTELKQGNSSRLVGAGAFTQVFIFGKISD